MTGCSCSGQAVLLQLSGVNASSLGCVAWTLDLDHFQPAGILLLLGVQTLLVDCLRSSYCHEITCLKVLALHAQVAPRQPLRQSLRRRPDFDVSAATALDDAALVARRSSSAEAAATAPDHTVETTSTPGTATTTYNIVFVTSEARRFPRLSVCCLRGVDVLCLLPRGYAPLLQQACVPKQTADSCCSTSFIFRLIHSRRQPVWRPEAARAAPARPA